MLLMDIVTWEPKDSDKVAALYANYEYPKGMKVLEEWFDVTGYRFFVIYETDDEKTYATSVFPFIGFCRFETFPIMNTEKYMQLDKKLTEKAGEKGIGAAQSKEIPEDISEQIKMLEKRVERLEHHSFIQQEDTT